MKKRGSQLAVLSLLAVTILMCSASIAMAAPVVKYLKVSNAVAYDLKSFQTTVFSTSVDTANTYADLRVKTSKGDIILYRGAIATANANFAFPKWNGMGSDGRRLTSATYDVVLTVSKGGLTTTAKTKVLVCGVCFGFSGTVTADDVDLTIGKGYLKPKATNIYITATTPTTAVDEGDIFEIAFWQPATSEPTEGTPHYLDSTHPLNVVEHRDFSRGGTGIYEFYPLAYFSQVTYKVTVMQ